MVWVLALALAVNPTYAAGSEPAIAQVQSLSSALLKAMQTGPATAVTGRYRKLEPVIDRKRPGITP
jgi:hypothetical protein